MAVYFIKEFGAPEAKDLFQAQIENIFERNGFIPLVYPRVNYFKRLFSLSNQLRSLPGDAIVLFIHPLYARTNRLLLRSLIRKKIKTVCVVSDINSLRDETINFEKETGYWKKVPYFIFQNEKMKELVEKKYGARTSIEAGLFDLLFEVKIPRRKKTNTVVFAGNTQKCPFVNDLNKIKPIDWKIYSAHYLPEYENVKHYFLQDEVSDKQPLEGSFGLVWEGDSIGDISNFRGRYLEFVSPLKLSNYLLLGLPVIIHKDAACAGFVRENKLGICVSSLTELPGLIGELSETEYNEMNANAAVFSEKLSNGYFTQAWIEGILKKISEQG